jgi:hypothetical protein
VRDLARQTAIVPMEAEPPVGVTALRQLLRPGRLLSYM